MLDNYPTRRTGDRVPAEESAGSGTRGRRLYGRGSRLHAVASLVPPASRVADIGCGHGILARVLLDSGRATHYIATEKGPQTLRRVQPMPQHNALELRCGDGLRVLRSSDRIDVVVLAGLGARAIVRILATGAPRELGVRRLVLQPQTEWARLRRWLVQNDFGIVEERLVFEGRRAYLILAAEPGAAGGPLRLAGLSTEDFYEAGPGLASAGPDVRRFWRGRLERDERWLARASSPAERDSARSRRDLARRVLAALDDRTARERPAD